MTFRAVQGQHPPTPTLGRHTQRISPCRLTCPDDTFGKRNAGRPLTLDTLAAALDWPRDRTGDALDAIRHQPAIADPPRPTSHRPRDVHPHHETGPPEPGTTPSTQAVSRRCRVWTSGGRLVVGRRYGLDRGR